MTQEDKDLLLKDLCVRLPYGVKASYSYFYEMTIKSINVYHITAELVNEGHKFAAVPIDDYKPYLRPMSSMTEEEKEEYCNLQDKFLCSSQCPVTDAYELFDWLNSHHFDYRGLIEKGLAIEAPEGMYNIKEK